MHSISEIKTLPRGNILQRKAQQFWEKGTIFNLVICLVYSFFLIHLFHFIFVVIITRQIHGFS